MTLRRGVSQGCRTHLRELRILGGFPGRVAGGAAAAGGAHACRALVAAAGRRAGRAVRVLAGRRGLRRGVDAQRRPSLFVVRRACQGASRRQPGTCCGGERSVQKLEARWRRKHRFLTRPERDRQDKLCVCPGSGAWFAWRDNRPTRMLVEYTVAHLRGGCGSQPGGLRLPAQPPRRCRTRRHPQRRRPLRLLRCPQRCRCREQTPCVGALCPSVAVPAPHGCLPRLPESAPCQHCLLDTRCCTSEDTKRHGAL